MQTRKEFIKQSCGFLILSSILGISVGTLSGCGSIKVLTLKEDNLNTVEINKKEFVNDKGGLQQFVKVRVSKLPFDILVVRIDENTFKAVYLMCSHQEQPLSVSKEGLFCSAHGSSFEFNGKVKNEPAVNPLRTFNTSVLGDKIKVYL